MSPSGALLSGLIAAVAQLAAPAGDGEPGDAAAALELPGLEEAVEALREIRGLEFKSPVPAVRQSQAELAQMIDQWIGEMIPADRIELVELGMVRLGMLTEPVGLADAMRKLFGAMPAAYYDPERERIVVVAEIPEYMKNIVVHEMMHALQDQHFDLEAMVEPYERFVVGEPRNEDGAAALRCLIEGEASYIEMIHTMAGHLPEDPKQLVGAFRMQAEIELDDVLKMMEQVAPPLEDERVDPLRGFYEALGDAPSFLSESFFSVYPVGAHMVASLVAHGGWDSVTAIYAGPPRTMEQALHPEKLTTEPDEPTPILFSTIDALAGTRWTEIDAAVWGEFYLRRLLRNYDSGGTAKRAAAGWDGDLYRAYRDDAGRTLIVLMTTWDSERDARQFHAAYDSILDRKYPDLVRDERDDTLYRCGEMLGYGVAMRRGTEVFIIEGGDEDLVRRILHELAAIPITRVQ